MHNAIPIDDDVLAAAKIIAEREHRSVGEVVSDLARKSLQPEPRRAERNGVPLLPVSRPNAAVTLEAVNRLRDELP